MCDTNIFYTELGVGNLLRQDGAPTIDAGPSKCARVACNYSGAIYWCNDNNHNITLENYDRLAWAATDIYEKCNTNLTYEGLTSGQNFYYDEGWNVIVREDTC
ncbi:hypothetical protein N8I77_006241 [Diaporthe amygdali]|uniref:Uncharacterized protein n=1 Tax=Phomopsis amygdali TaxID=1214568 RepID=A0AAD9SHD6_PHOAM|nr:hypothetical protein N8I77_006241 [Diaporthe amygdali]